MYWGERYFPTEGKELTGQYTIIMSDISDPTSSGDASTLEGRVTNWQDQQSVTEEPITLQDTINSLKRWRVVAEEHSLPATAEARIFVRTQILRCIDNAIEGIIRSHRSFLTDWTRISRMLSQGDRQMVKRILDKEQAVELDERSKTFIEDLLPERRDRLDLRKSLNAFWENQTMLNTWVTDDFYTSQKQFADGMRKLENADFAFGRREASDDYDDSLKQASAIGDTSDAKSQKARLVRDRTRQLVKLYRQHSQGSFDESMSYLNYTLLDLSKHNVDTQMGWKLVQLVDHTALVGDPDSEQDTDLGWSIGDWGIQSLSNIGVEFRELYTTTVNAPRTEEATTAARHELAKGILDSVNRHVQNPDSDTPTGLPNPGDYETLVLRLEGVITKAKATFPDGSIMWSAPNFVDQIGLAGVEGAEDWVPME
ncbi:hypothetical protein BD324DRAFT_247327 [Kockovaella imperatae]|uniref:Uncharacterized protein n=1 Tax=Kockovaella imperatae TaxID=4999 RepID=A0A1Y1UQX2_9TREE|nr:hypothetical protein BD324DRAFT_247327 [Kockovaella imperatae]ORX39977.1 hypothetical protein BD324DRAFT_247327 [Kockovaella imperatae]